MEITDHQLVTATIEGDHDAFARIVDRYQRLLCSLAFAATSDLSRSEDIAQEAFVTAWKQIGKLREPEKLKSWLCGILRNTIRHSVRKNQRDPLHAPEDPESLDTLSDKTIPVEETTMQREESEMMSKALEKVPIRYREPLILYYREERSVARVAAALDIKEAAVKQRLLRGRKLLKEKMLTMVESALERSTPGKVFTAGVVAAIATTGPSAKAAAIGASGVGMTQAGMTVKTASLAAFLASISGFISTIISFRIALDQSRTKRERRHTAWLVSLIFLSFIALIASLFGLKEAVFREWMHPVTSASIAQAIIIGFSIGFPLLLWSLLKQTRRLRTLEREREPEAFLDPRDRKGSKESEWKSKRKLLGIPLIHIRYAAPEEDSKPIVAWIAGGDRAVGILFAWGAYAAGFFSVGAVSCGVFTLGAVSLGVISIGSIAIGALALGACAIGFHAMGGLSALGWLGAQGGGFSIARFFAEGPIAIAGEANSQAAREFFANPNADAYLLFFFIIVSFFSIVPSLLYAKEVRRRLGPKKN